MVLGLIQYQYGQKYLGTAGLRQKADADPAVQSALEAAACDGGRRHGRLGVLLAALRLTG